MILAEPIVQTGAARMAGAWFIAGMGRISIKERNTDMASDYVDDILRDERESFKRKETAAKKFDNRLDGFRKSAKALREAARQFETAFPGMSRTAVADKWAMTGTEKNIAFDSKGELVAEPAGRKPESTESSAPDTEAAAEPTTAETDTRTADDGTAPQANPAETQEPSDDGRPAWTAGNY